MIICHDTDPPFVFISVTKCATMSMYPALLEYPGAFRKAGPFHCRVLDHGTEDYFHLAVCRNPYDRAVSLWWSTTQRVDAETGEKADRYKIRRRCPDPDSFEGFIRYVARGGHTTNRDLLCTQTAWLAGIRIDRYLRFEHLEAEFRALPFYDGRPKQLPHNNTTIDERRPWYEYMTPDAAALINRYYAADFERFKYPMTGS